MHIARGDKEGVFAEAISKDGRSYNEQVLLKFLFIAQEQGWKSFLFSCERGGGGGMCYVCFCKLNVQLYQLSQ